MQFNSLKVPNLIKWPADDSTCLLLENSKTNIIDKIIS